VVVKNEGTRLVLWESGSAAARQALPTCIALLPATLIQFFELLFGVGVLGVARFEDSWRGREEGLFRWDAIDPALLGELLVVGKAEAEEKLDGFVGFGCFGLVVGFAFAFCLDFSVVAAAGSSAGAPSVARANL